MKYIYVIASCFVLTSCATGYKEYGILGGYKETKIETNVYQLSYLGNGSNTPQVVEKFWHKRASELCKGGSYEHVYTDTKPNYIYSQYGTYAHPKIIGTVTCKPAT